MIQEFLTNNLIQITEDVNVNKLLKASAILEKKLTKDKSKIPTFTLIALDPEIKVTDPNVQEVQQLIINNWKTFTSNCKDTPLTYIRAVIFETLEKLSSDINIANVIWLCSRHIQIHYNLRGKEKELVTKFLIEIGNKIEATAAQNWSISTESKIQKLKTEIKKISGVSIDSTELQTQLMAATSHKPWGGGGENPYWTTQSNLNWPNFFSERAAQGITELINSAFNKQSRQLNEIQVKTQELLNNSIAQLLNENSQRNSSLQLRTELIWWKEACYSKTLQNSYKNFENGLLQIILALDYSSFIPFIFPQSIDYFLKETHKGIITEEDKKITFSEIFKLIDGSNEKLRQHLSEETFENERISLAEFVKGFVFGQYSLKHLKNNVGISENTELTLSEFTLWLFHDLQVLNSIKNK